MTGPIELLPPPRVLRLRDEAPASGFDWMPVALAAALVVAVIVGRRRRGRGEEERAFRRLARLSGIGKQERERLRRAAGEGGMPPVAWLICRVLARTESGRGDERSRSA